MKINDGDRLLYHVNSVNNVVSYHSYLKKERYISCLLES